MAHSLRELLSVYKWDTNNVDTQHGVHTSSQEQQYPRLRQGWGKEGGLARLDKKQKQRQMMSVTPPASEKATKKTRVCTRTTRKRGSARDLARNPKKTVLIWACTRKQRCVKPSIIRPLPGFAIENNHDLKHEGDKPHTFTYYFVRRH